MTYKLKRSEDANTDLQRQILEVSLENSDLKEEQKQNQKELKSRIREMENRAVGQTPRRN